MSKNIGDENKFIVEVVFTPDKKTAFTLVEITVDLLQQKDAYMKFYNELAKDVKVSGFRKGHVPQEIVEPKVYPQAVKNTQQYLMEKVLEEINYYIKRENSQYLIDIMEVKDVKFTLMDVPMKLILRVLMLDASLGNISKIKIDKSTIENIKIDPKDVKKTIKRLWDNWLKKATDKKILKQYSEVNDEWIKSVLKIKKVESMYDLKEYIRKQLLDNKQQVATSDVLKDFLQQAREASNLKLPEDYLQEIIKREKKQAEKQLKENNLTLETYLKTQKKSIEDFEQGVIDQTNDQVLTELLFRIYSKTNNISLDKNNEKDELYMKEAQKYVQPSQVPKGENLGMQLLSKYMQKVTRTALNIKAQVLLAKEVGLNLMNDPDGKILNKKKI